MRVGFPVVVEGHGEIVKVFVSEIDATGAPGLLCRGLGGVDLALDFEKGWSPTYAELGKPVLHRGKSILLHFEGGSAVSRASLLNEKRNALDLDGTSGALAVHLVSQLAEALRRAPGEGSVLVSGRLRPKDAGFLVDDLGAGGEVDRKVAGTTEDLWVHRNDYDRLRKLGNPREGVIPFAAPEQKIDWLLHEFCQKYGVEAQGLGEDWLEKAEGCGPQTELDLFEVAIDEALFEGNLEEGSLAQAFEAHFLQRAPRLLLPIQQKIFDKDEFDENKTLASRVFYRGSSSIGDLRHVLISGPTGCGKTTLLHSLVLNGLHNRGGGVLYVGPVKALVEEFHASIEKSLAGLLPHKDEQPIFISTGDYARNDSQIARGRFGLACMVNEKANVLFSSGDPLAALKKLSLVIIDEMHMLRDASRGGVLDMLLTKVAREARSRRHAPVHRPLQVVMVSTENMATDVRKMRAYLWDAEDRDTQPVLLDTPSRPLKVHHSAVVFSEIDASRSERPIVSFQNNTDRRIDEGKRRALVRTLGPGRDDWGKWVKKDTRDAPRSFRHADDLISEKRKQHKTIIASLSSVESTYSTADKLAEQFTHALDQHKVDPEFLVEARRSGLGKLQNSLIAWARKGVYVHHSQLPRRLRAKIEAIFRVPPLPNSRPKILLTTETLTYGVNLSASCVILSGLERYRDDPVAPFDVPKPMDLDANQYHNLLGRAGRLGLMEKGQEAEAIVCIPASRFVTPEKRELFLHDFYGDAGTPTLFTSLAQPIDLSWWDYDKAKDSIQQPAKGLRIEQFSFSVFRSTLDALRTAGSNAENAEVLDVLESTLCYQAAAQRTRAKLKACFSEVLELAADYEKNRIKLVNRVGRKFVMTAAATALIDTGTSLVSVEPMATWLERMKAYRKTSLPPAEAAISLLPGLIAAPDFTKVACELIHGATSPDKFVNQETAQMRLNKIRTLSVRELERIGLAALAGAIDEYLREPEIIDNLKLIPVTEKRAIVFWQLLTAVLRWLHGDATEKVVEPLVIFRDAGDPTERNKRWLPKHSDRLEQLAKMCYRFFSMGEKDDFLSDQQKLQLPQLALRLKHGIPFTATPYLNAFGMDGILPREAVVELHEAVPDPFRLLSNRGAEITRIQQVVQLGHTNAEDASEVIQVVRRAYEDYRANFLNTIDREAAEPFIDAVRDVLRNEPEAFGPRWSAGPLLDRAAASLEDLLHDSEASFELHRAPGALGLAPPGVDETVRFSVGDPVGGQSMKVLAWHDAPPAGQWSITPCGFILLVSLVLRRLVGTEQLATALQGEPARMDVYWIASNLWMGAGLEAMAALREDLLSFIEPVQARAA